jgi:uncharacterized RDD family membrane protein YckC
VHKTVSTTDENIVSPGLLRRIMAMLYDGFLLIALFAVVSLPLVVQVGEQVLTHDPLMKTLLRVLLLLSAFLFFGWFWTHGGQTLGMRAWRLRAQKTDGSAMDWSASIKRFAWSLLSLAFFGLGFFWILLDRQGLSWHDRLSHTRLVLIPKKSVKPHSVK